MAFISADRLPGKALREEARQFAAEDGSFYKNFLYMFEIQVLDLDSNFLIPLVINPEEITMTEPFAMAPTPTSDAGLYLEENGIIQRDIRIRGHTGFKVRNWQGGNLDRLGSIANKRTFGRKGALRSSGSPVEGFSGQRHFQFLQDAFRAYGDLKRDPDTSAGTRMLFHMPKDKESWTVAPRSFTMRRTKDARVLYEYEIDLLAYRKGENVEYLKAEEDTDVIDSIQNVTRMLNSAVNTVRGVVQDTTALMSEIENTVSNIGTVFSNAVGVIDDAANLVNGTATLIASPFDAVTSTLSALNTSLTTMENAGSTFPDTITNSVRRMEDAFHQIGAHPDAFADDTQLFLRKITQGQELTTSRTRQELEAAAAEAPPNSFQALLAKGTANTTGDLLRAQGEMGVGRALNQYRSAVEKTVKQGDTLELLAMRYLGDARKWRHIALLNDLEYPYLTEGGLPRTRKVGDAILIPSKAEAPKRRFETPVVGVASDKSSEVRALGTDIALEEVGGGLYDIPIDTDHGSNDFKYVSGLDNLKQALVCRLTTERGTDPLYKNLGMDAVIGMPIPAVQLEMIRFRATQAVEADPRISAVRNLALDNVVDDKLVTEIEAEVIGLTERTSISIGV